MRAIRLAFILAVLAAITVTVVPANARPHHYDRHWTHRHRQPSPSGTVLFDGSNVSAWPLNQSCAPDRTQMVADPAGSGQQVMRFTVLNTDVAPCTPTDNPRAQLISPQDIYQQGHAYWVSYELYLPAGFPTVTSWLGLGEPIYGYPWNGSPSVGFAVDNQAITNDPAGEFRWQDNGFETPPWQVLWASPVVTGQWVRVTWHFQVATNGYCELYVNGALAASEHPFQVLDGANSQGPWFAALNVYYQHDQFPQATVFFRDFKIATTEASATG